MNPSIAGCTNTRSISEGLGIDGRHVGRLQRRLPRQGDRVAVLVGVAGGEDGERIYAAQDRYGLLIYTGGPDAEGTQTTTSIARSSCPCSACRTRVLRARGMTEALLALPAHLRKRLEHALDSGTLAPPYRAAAVDAAVGGVSESEAVARALGELHGLGVSGPWLRGVAARSRSSRHSAHGARLRLVRTGGRRPARTGHTPRVRGTARIGRALSVGDDGCLLRRPACFRGAGPLDGRDARAAIGHDALRGGGGQRLNTEGGYGLPIGSRFVGTPGIGLRTSQSSRDYRIGYGMQVLKRGQLNLELGIDAERRKNPIVRLQEQSEAPTSASSDAPHRQ